jgi:hypothetical protein
LLAIVAPHAKKSELVVHSEEPRALEQLRDGLRAIGCAEERLGVLLETQAARDFVRRSEERGAAGAAALDALGPEGFVSLLACAAELMGSLEVALAWLSRPNRYLGGEVPLLAAATDTGLAAVRQSLCAIAYGGVA